MTATIDYTVIQGQLAEATREGTVSLELLDTAVESTHPDGYEGIPYSQGVRWISEHTQLFLELLEAAGSSVEEFYRRHLDNFHVGEDLLNNEWLLLALGDEQRVPFVREVFLAAGAAYDYWLVHALKVGISKDDLAEMIFEKLRQTKVEYRYNVINFTKHAFVGNGSGRVRQLTNGHGVFEEPDSYWGILDDEQLLTAMQIVAKTAPNMLFSGRGSNEWFTTSEKLRLRLGDSKVDALLELAATNLQSFDLVSLDVMAKLPLCVQLDLARRFTPSGTWVIQMALEMDAANGGFALLKELGDVLRTNSVTTYKWWLTQEPDSDNLRLSQEIERRLLSALRDEGWLTGTLKTEKYQGRTQLYVRAGQCKYIKDRRQITYDLPGGSRKFPHAGDVVLFRRGSGYPLVSGRLYATTFTLVKAADSK
ncbi:MAG TPA: hypothetical protein VFH06_05020 [Candidatus Saccharimonadales bacterium]|nr:hypothetical protein [Candidatus Saccharimonadales bacterium]